MGSTINNMFNPSRQDGLCRLASRSWTSHHENAALDTSPISTLSGSQEYRKNTYDYVLLGNLP